MRKVCVILLWAVILAEAALYLGLYRQYEGLAAEKAAVERRAGVLKTLFDQTEKELTAEKEKWQAEKQALLAAQKEAMEQEPEKKPGAYDAETDLTGLLQGVYARWREMQEEQPETPAVSPTAAPETASPTAAPETSPPLFLRRK